MNTRSMHSRLILAALICASSSPVIARPTGRGCGADGACAVLPASTAPLELSQSDRTALQFQIDEERMARELYTAFGAQWDLRPFTRIPDAESRHEAALRALAARAGMTVPAATPGRFATAEVQKRHDTLLARGRESAEAALRAGAFVEEQDIADLRTLAAATDSAELRQVVAALERASGHHLAACVRTLAARGVTYTPQVLAADAYATLSADDRGRAGCGRNRGGRRGWSG